MVFTLSWFGQVSHPPPCLTSGTGTRRLHGKGASTFSFTSSENEASTQNGTDIQKFYQKNLTCHVSAGSRLVLLRTKQIATQSFIPEFSIFSSKKTASLLSSSGVGSTSSVLTMSLSSFNELWKRSALFLGTVGGALWLTRTRFRATSVVHYRDLPLMYRLALGVSSGSPVIILGLFVVCRLKRTCTASLMSD
ncbi:hypothetical protein PAPYR_12857 [Paratrimastix pyriformis]|uniref:Transmembrane protein n=1 Tax=Paratrimastix pyriformis TaxID=342808 RepID=A0ABQ8U4S6_9EUKA|nr:hypothetical protein PAPYR_12857 [Paratrimastix pyriformis]